MKNENILFFILDMKLIIAQVVKFITGRRCVSTEIKTHLEHTSRR